MIYVTGDMHGDLSRFKSKELRALTKHDTLIVCGDFGFVWDDSPRERRRLKWIGKRRYNVLFVEGPNDNLELLARYPSSEWNGGSTREISGRLRQLLRGEVFRIEDRTIFAFGGGESEDDARTLGSDCEERELPSERELERAWENLRRLDCKVDYIITHQPSRKIKQFLDTERQDANILDTFLDEVRARCSYKRWFCGSLHKNKQIPPSDTIVFQAVVKAE